MRSIKMARNRSLWAVLFFHVLTKEEKQKKAKSCRITLRPPEERKDLRENEKKPDNVKYYKMRTTVMMINNNNNGNNNHPKSGADSS